MFYFDVIGKTAYGREKACLMSMLGDVIVVRFGDPNHSIPTELSRIQQGQKIQYDRLEQ